MKVHLQLNGSPAGAKVGAADIAAAGADGVFTFEGQHDVFFRCSSPPVRPAWI
jgi:hypothetical protein